MDGAQEITPPDALPVDDADNPLLNLTQLAACFRVSENTITKWRTRPDNPMPVEVEGGNGKSYGFRFSDCKAWRDEIERVELAERAAGDAFVRKQQADFLNIKPDQKQAGLSPKDIREIAQAELIYMQAAARRRALVPLEDMIELTDAILTAMRAAMDGMPDYLEREFSLTGAQVQKVVGYCDGVLSEAQEAIAKAALVEDLGDAGGDQRDLF